LKWGHVYVPLRKCLILRPKTSRKTGEPRVIALNDEALDILHELPHTGDHVFLSRFHRPYTPAGLRAILREHCGITPYALRHSYAQASIDQGTHPEIVTKMLGQKTSRMVWTYARIRDEQMIEAPSRLRLRRADGAA
jgi:integrase